MKFFWDISFFKRLLLTDDASLHTPAREETLEQQNKRFTSQIIWRVGFADVIFRVERSDDWKYVYVRRLCRSRLFNSSFVNEKFKQPPLDSTASGSVSLSRYQSKVSFPEQRPIIELCGRYFMYRDIYCTTTSTLTQLLLNFTLGTIYFPIHEVPYRAFDGDGY